MRNSIVSLSATSRCSNTVYPIISTLVFGVTKYRSSLIIHVVLERLIKFSFLRILFCMAERIFYYWDIKDHVMTRHIVLLGRVKRVHILK